MTEHLSQFPTTHWTQINDARASGEALAAVLTRYAPAIRAHLIRRKGIKPNDADDLTQEFLTTKALERDLIAAAERDRGKFRTFVLTVLDRFIVSEQRRQQAVRRGGRMARQSMKVLEASPAGDDPSAEFDREWARQVVQEAVERMRFICHTSGRREMWRLFEARVAQPALEGVAPRHYDELVRELGLPSPAQASNTLMTAKRMFIRSLRAVIGEYAREEKQIDAEIDELLAALSGS